MLPLIYSLLLLGGSLSVFGSGTHPTIRTRGDGTPVVDVGQGRIMGVQMYEYGVDYLAFLSIPYAKPPVDALRFKNPEASEPWLGDLNATVLPHNCVQFILAGREDCLYLNVYTPLNALNASSPLPVLVWIHGGGYYMGGSSDNHNFEPLLQRDVIVVMIQYRLGVLGFMSTEDDAAPGNLGLKDQTLAMQWVYDNIAAFGGDTSRITIFGASAGAASVHYQLVAPSAAGLFSGAVMISGNAFGPWASGRDFLWAAQEIAINFGCPTSPSDDLITCLQGVNEHELDAMYLHFAQWNLQPFYFAPRVDGVYIPEEPATLMKEGRYSHVPTLMGINRDEMALESVEWYAVPGLLENLAANFTVLGPITLELYNDEDPVNTATAVYDYYNGGTNFSKENCDNLTKMLSDGFFAIRHDWLAELMVEQDSVYLYELHHRGEHGYTNIYLENGLDLPQAANYISHSDQSQYLFNPKFSELQTPEDRAVGNIFVDTWTNFAKTGNPTSDGSLGFTWEVSSAPDLRHLKIIPNPLMEGDSRSSERVFWNSLPLRINNLLKP